MANDKKQNVQTFVLFDDRESGKVVECPCIVLEDPISVMKVKDLCQEVDANFQPDGNEYGAKTTRGLLYYVTFDYDDGAEITKMEYWPDDDSEELVSFVLIGDMKGYWPTAYIVNSLDWRNDLRINSVPK